MEGLKQNKRSKKAKSSYETIYWPNLSSDENPVEWDQWVVRDVEDGEVGGAAGAAVRLERLGQRQQRGGGWETPQAKCHTRYVVGQQPTVKDKVLQKSKQEDIKNVYFFWSQ